MEGGTKMGQSKHDKISKNLAIKFKTEYNEGKGPDLKPSGKIIEVVTHVGDLYSSIDQLKGFRKPRYIATTPKLVSKAKEVTKNTKIGVMSSGGSIRKRAR